MRHQQRGFSPLAGLNGSARSSFQIALPGRAGHEARPAEVSSGFRPPRPEERELRDLTLTVGDNARHLTVSQCYENLERIDELIAKNGEKPRYLESRQFFERQLARCLKRRDAEHPNYGE